MRGFRLNGWQRMGILASVVWAIVGGFLGMKILFDPIWTQNSACTDLALSGHLDFKNCQQLLDAQLANAEAHRWYGAAIVGLAPIPIVWLIAYTLIGLVGWIRRGFQP